jgi:hypothetical protein
LACCNGAEEDDSSNEREEIDIMAEPDLTIAVEPMEAGKAVYLPLAARAADQDPQIKCVLRLRITNNEPTQVVVNAIQFSFPGSATPAKDMQGIAFVLDPDGATTAAQAMGAIQPGQIATWSNGVVDLSPDPNVKNIVSNVVYLPAPAPPQIKVSVSCNGFASPASVTLAQVPYTSPTSAGAFLFPFNAADLAEGEYAVTSARHWANGGASGTQIFAHDVSIQIYDQQTDGWSQLKTGGSKMNNDDYRIWGKPVRAVADGIVEDWVDGMVTNTITADADGNLQLPSPTPILSPETASGSGMAMSWCCTPTYRPGLFPHPCWRKVRQSQRARSSAWPATPAMPPIRTRTFSVNGTAFPVRCGECRSATPGCSTERALTRRTRTASGSR